MGGWKEIQGPVDEDTVPWRENERYFKDRIVSYKGKRYKATGAFINAAKPGNRRDKIFTQLFGSSLFVYVSIVLLQMTIVLTQLFLMHNAHWDRLIALCLEQFHGYFNLFRIVRNWLAGKLSLIKI